MKSSVVVALIVSIIIGFSAYLATNNYIVGIAIGLIYLLYYFIFALKKINAFSKKNYRIHNCYKFINSFLITMSVRDSLEEAYRSGVQGSTGELKHIVNDIENLDNNERLNYLRKHFNLSVYKMFLNIVELYLDQGGNILKMADSLIAETTRIEDSINKSNHSIKRNIFEFIILWGMSLGILLFMRFGISSFYMTMLKSYLFLGLVVLYFLIILVSIHMAILRSTELYIKEDNL